MGFEEYHLGPPMCDHGDEFHARYEAGRRRAGRRLQNLPHTIILDMLRETTQSQEVVSVCPARLRLERNTVPVDGRMLDPNGGQVHIMRLEPNAAPAAAPRGGGPLVYRTGDCMYVWGHGQWHWAIDEVLYDHRYECFVARYMDGPPAYLPPDLAVWAITTWTRLGSLDADGRSYAEWLAWFYCKSWNDVVAELESHGVVAAGAAEHLFELRQTAFEAPESPGGGAAYARILTWPQEPAAVAHHPEGVRHGQRPPAAAAAFIPARLLLYPSPRPPVKAAHRLQAKADHGRAGCPAARLPAKAARMRGFLASIVGAVRCTRSSSQGTGATAQQLASAPC